MALQFITQINTNKNNNDGFRVDNTSKIFHILILLTVQQSNKHDGMTTYSSIHYNCYHNQQSTEALKATRMITKHEGFTSQHANWLQLEREREAIIPDWYGKGLPEKLLMTVVTHLQLFFEYLYEMLRSTLCIYCVNYTSP